MKIIKNLARRFPRVIRSLLIMLAIGGYALMVLGGASAMIGYVGVDDPLAVWLHRAPWIFGAGILVYSYAMAYLDVSFSLARVD